MTGTASPVGLVVGSAVRRDRVLLLVWVAVLVALVLASALAVADLYGTTASRVAAARALNADPATVALYGPIVEPRSLGELAMTKLTVTYALAVAALSLVLVRRHTRSDEEYGRTELLAATPVGRPRLFWSAFVLAAVVSVLVGGLASVADVLSGLPTQGSVAFGVAWAGTGLVAAAWTALVAQLTVSSRACAGIAAAGLGVAFVARAVADVADGWGWLGWVSPLGWNTRLHAWAEPRWWMVALWLGLTALLLVAAARLQAARDLGEGLVAERPGPARGRLGGIAALTWRTHRSGLLGWGVVMLALGAGVGVLAPGLDDLFDDPSTRDLLARLGGPGGVTDALLGAVFGIGAIAVAGWAVAAVVRAVADEQAGRAESLLATAVPRRAWAAATAVTALAPPLLYLALVGLGAGLTLGAHEGDVAGEVARLVPAALAPAPAAVVVGAATLLLAGWSARAAVLGWALLAAAVVLDELGPLLDLPTAVLDVSPFHVVPAAPGEDAGNLAQLVLLAVSVGLIAVAHQRFARRDLG